VDQLLDQLLTAVVTTTVSAALVVTATTIAAAAIVATAATGTATATAATGRTGIGRRRVGSGGFGRSNLRGFDFVSHLELQSAFTSGIGEGFHPAVKQETTAIEDDA